MAKELLGARERAEAKFDKAQKTTDEAKGVVDTELQATRKKTALLRQERLAKEAAEGVSDLDKKPGKKPIGARPR
jgi:hypothetical protein